MSLFYITFVVITSHSKTVNEHACFGRLEMKVRGIL